VPWGRVLSLLRLRVLSSADAGLFSWIVPVGTGIRLGGRAVEDLVKMEGNTLVVLLLGSLPDRAGVTCAVFPLQSRCEAEPSPSLLREVILRAV